jgi:colicin import membrane protein
MNRLQKKCFLASAGLHCLLFLILLVGPAFLAPREKPDNLPVLDFVPFRTVDALVSGGGNPEAKPPPPAPVTPPQPAPPPVVAPPAPAPRPEPEPEKVAKPEPPKITRLDSESLEPAKEQKNKIVVNTKPVIRNAEDLGKARARAEAREREIADARRRAAATAIRNAVEGIKGGTSGSTEIELKGPGGGGVPYANFLQAVKSVYANAWIVPEGVTDESATAAASVTIARDGTVISARIISSSGNTAVDRSVQTTLDRVKYAAPLPDDAKEDQRTVTINFNVKAKLLG